MYWIDGHLDLAYLELKGRDMNAPCTEPNACITLPELQAADIRIACGTIFTEATPEDTGEPYAYRPDDPAGARRAGELQRDFYLRNEQAGHLRLVRTAADLEPTAPHQPPAIVLLIEGGDPLTPETAAAWHADGMRMVGLAWAMGTRYAGGNMNHGPLTPAGRDLVAALDACGIIHDASHLSDEAFEGLFDCARGPIVATHSNSRAVLGSDNQRHLTDDQIRAIAGRGGIIGLNLCGSFLANDRRATLADCVEHVCHVAEVAGGRQHVALGSDADGGFGTDRLPEGCDHPAKFGNLLSALGEAGFSEDDLRGFAHGNWLRYLKEHLPK